MHALDKMIRKLRGLKQNQDKSDDEIYAMAKEKLLHKEIVDSLTFCIDEKEKQLASNLLKQYLNELSVENSSDRDTLRQLIDLSILSERIKDFLKKEYEKSNPALPTHMMNELRSTNEQILVLKDRLFKDQANSTWLDDWQKLKKKALKYYEEHKGCNIVKCPYCFKLFRLMMKTTDLEPKQATFFKGTILYNHKLYDLYHHKRINKLELSEIFGVSEQFIEYLYSEIYLKNQEGK